MKIAVLGWGSLIWDPESLQIADKWQMTGPRLPIEFARISDNGRLTLVIDEVNGAEVPTRYAISAFDRLEDAVENLRVREGPTKREWIGSLEVGNGQLSEWAGSQHAKTCAKIKDWADATKLDGVIWTAIPPRFEGHTKGGWTGEAFSVEAAIRYLSQLTGEKQTTAFEYIKRAPLEVVTPVRRAANAAFSLG
jgi:hypothetical protein